MIPIPTLQISRLTLFLPRPGMQEPLLQVDMLLGTKTVAEDIKCVIVTTIIRGKGVSIRVLRGVP